MLDGKCTKFACGKGVDYVLRGIKNRAFRRRKEYLQMDLKGSEAHLSGQVNCVLLLANAAEMINSVWAGMRTKADLICM